MNEIETCKDQTGPQHIPSLILAGCEPDIHVFGLKIEFPLFFHDQHLSPNVSTSGRIFGPAEVEHTTMGTLSGL